MIKNVDPMITMSGGTELGAAPGGRCGDTLAG